VNLAVLLEMAAESFGERTAVRCGDTSYGYTKLLAAADSLAARLRASGVRHAALLDVTSPAVPLLLFAAARAGLPFAPLSYRLTDAELGGLLARLEPVWLTTDSERAARLADRAGVIAVAREHLDPSPEPGPSGHGARPAGDAAADPDAVAVLLFTSGTTGAPKAAVLRHRHLVSYVLASVEFGAADPEEATLVAVPPYHVAGIAAIVSSVYAGRRIVQLPVFEAAAWLDVARTERITHAFVVPTMLARIVDALEAGAPAPPALRALAYGGGPMPRPVIERALSRLPAVAFTNAYGLTETSSTITLLGPDDHRAAAASDDPVLRRRLASAGRVLPGIELEIRNADGSPQPVGARGEVWVRGEQVAGEYLGAAQRRTAEGWFPTRDAGWLDAEGYLFLEGRLDDVIVRGGENLSPGEIEDVLRGHPAVADCAVVGLPDEQWGESVAAVVGPRAETGVDAEELRAWVRERLRSSRTPARIEFRDRLPYTETGKLLRRRVRAELLDTPEPP
jgi:acyl-CoA synthetase (AMP-forming)/AMP-acid ligase II